jgi:hypothetical protein
MVATRAKDLVVAHADIAPTARAGVFMNDVSVNIGGNFVARNAIHPHLVNEEVEALNVGFPVFSFEEIGNRFIEGFTIELWLLGLKKRKN